MTSDRQDRYQNGCSGDNPFRQQETLRMRQETPNDHVHGGGTEDVPFQIRTQARLPCNDWFGEFLSGIIDVAPVNLLLIHFTWNMRERGRGASESGGH